MSTGENKSRPEVFINTGAKDVSFYTPVQDPVAGTPFDIQPEGSLFSPLRLGNITLHNRIIVSPMCQYSAEDGYVTSWHKQHLGTLAARGPGLIITEVHAVSPQGRITPEDAGIWKDEQLKPLKDIVDFVHSQGSKIAIQIGHAGRKASTVAPWLDRKATAVEKANGWPDDVVAPSAIPYSPDSLVPRVMTKEEIVQLKQDWVDAVKRALTVGFDAIEIHAAHGYLLNTFLSPASNQRTDEYGGSFENRTRLLLEIVQLTRSVLPDGYPLLVRIPGTDYLNFDPSLPQWHIEEAEKLALMLADSGVDVLDVSGGGLDSRQKITSGPGYQVPWAAIVKRAVKDKGVAVTSVGVIVSGKQAQGYISEGSIDAVLVGRGFLKDPNLVWHWAEELDIDIHIASQYGWGFGITRTHRPRKS